MAAPQTSQENHRLVTLLALTLAVISALVFLPVRNHEFLNWDDQSYVTENDHVKGGLTQKGITWAFTQSHSANWHPLTWISHALDCQIYGLQPGGHHLTNVLFHALNATLLFLLLFMLTGFSWRSFMVAALFALHPLHVESVAWVAERKDVLSTFFGLLTLMAYVRYVKTRGGTTPHLTLSPNEAERAGRAWYGVALVLFALGLMSKPMLVTWPFVMLLLDHWPLNRIRIEANVFSRNAWTLNQRLIREKLPFLALAIGSCIITLLAQKADGAVASFAHLPISHRLQNAAVAYTEYLTRFFWPANLSPIYPHPAHWEPGRVAGSVIILVGLSGAVWFYRRRLPYGVTGWLWFLGTLVPVIGIVQVGSQAFADRYTYVPQIGLAVGLVWLAAAAVNKPGLPKSIGGVVAVVLLGTLAWRTMEQLRYWKNTETLFRRTLELYPDNTQALNGLGGYYIMRGRMAEGKQMLERVLQREPTFVEARGTLADALDGEGLHGEAVTQYEAALAVQPDNASLMNNLAWLRAACPDASIRNGGEAVRLATRACELTHYNKPLFIGTLAAAQAETGDFQNAIKTAERAATLAATLGLKETAARNQELTELYKLGKAAHGGLPKP